MKLVKEKVKEGEITFVRKSVYQLNNYIFVIFEESNFEPIHLTVAFCKDGIFNDNYKALIGDYINTEKGRNRILDYLTQFMQRIDIIDYKIALKSAIVELSKILK